MSSRSYLLLVATSVVVATAAIPTELFSTAVYTKLLATASSSSSGVPTAWPEYTDSEGAWLDFDATTWTSAFFASTLYLLHERHAFLCPATTPTAVNGSDTDWLALARSWSEGLYTPDEALTNTHDVGFLSWPAQAELRLDAGNATAKAAVLLEAQHLAARFSSIVGCTKSWDNGGAGAFEVIIDNMVNLELLMMAASLTSNTTYSDMATSHANKTMANHIRADYTSYHVVDYSPTTGEVEWRGTAQGFSNTSTWSRGQSWGVYGYAQMYNSTKIEAYLDTARNMAEWYLTHLPSVGVAYWDFDAPEPAPLDTSSSLILSSALLHLSSIEASRSNSTGSTYWSNQASTLLTSIVSESVTGWNGASLVGNGTVDNRADPPNNNTGIVYGDTFFIEAGNRLLQLGLVNCSDGSPARGAGLASLAKGSDSSGSTSITTSVAPSSTSSSAGATATKTSSAGRLSTNFGALLDMVRKKISKMY